MATLDEYYQSGMKLLRQGVPLAAYDTVAAGLREFPGSPQLRQLMAQSLARSGASRRANALLHDLVNEGHTDEETVALLARTHKDLWAQTRDPVAQRQHLESAFRFYLEAYLPGRYWSGINAATLALLLGDRDQSRRLARDVRDLCLEKRNALAVGEDPYWLLATLGEAALLLGDVPGAERWYREAAGIAGPRFGDLVSTRRNARLILRHDERDPASIEACFPIPKVAVFSGHLVDGPERAVPRFPPALEGAVARALAACVARLDIGFGYASAASGGDILFLEALKNLATGRRDDAAIREAAGGRLRGQERHIVLPYHREQFKTDCVTYLDDQTWAGRYEAVLADATSVVTASDQRMLGGAVSYEYGFLLLDGTAAVRALELDTELVCVALWDGRPGDGPGGTAAAVEHWSQNGRRVEIVDLGALSSSTLATVTAPSAGGVPIATGTGDALDGRPVPTDSAGFRAQVVGLLFADVAGFSKLTEEQIPRFVEHVLGTVAAVLRNAAERPLLSNTWGDGLYLVFGSVRETGLVALRLNEALREIDWAARGLPPTLRLRVAVHAGPAYACVDPVTSRQNYLGAHVALAARIEPVTPPGEVYGSGAFAALATSGSVREFVCAYVGQTPLAKGFGTYPMYILRRRI
jgi:class 3 adenylate cyclase